LVEYALIVAAVGLALITTVNQLSTAVVSLYSSITQGLASIGTTGQ
jgi:Flp pilus assembly pilin Flp